MKPKTLKTLATILPLMLLSLALQSCATPARSLPTTAQDNTKRLIERADFRLAAQAAPEWTKDALRTITKLETDLANK